MSYGRGPFYIYACACEGGADDMHGLSFGREHVVFDCHTNVARDALAQFIASAHWRGELAALVDRGYELRPELDRRASQSTDWQPPSGRRQRRRAPGR